MRPVCDPRSRRTDGGWGWILDESTGTHIRVCKASGGQDGPGAGRERGTLGISIRIQTMGSARAGDGGEFWSRRGPSRGERGRRSLLEKVSWEVRGSGWSPLRSQSGFSGEFQSQGALLEVVGSCADSSGEAGQSLFQVPDGSLAWPGRLGRRGAGFLVGCVSRSHRGYKGCRPLSPAVDGDGQRGLRPQRPLPASQAGGKGASSLE